MLPTNLKYTFVEFWQLCTLCNETVWHQGLEHCHQPRLVPSCSVSPHPHSVRNNHCSDVFPSKTSFAHSVSSHRVIQFNRALQLLRSCLRLLSLVVQLCTEAQERWRDSGSPSCWNPGLPASGLQHRVAKANSTSSHRARGWATRWAVLLRPAWSGNSGGRRNAGSQLPSTPAAPASPARAPSACLGVGGRRSERPRTKRKVGAARRAGRGIGWAGGVAKGSGLSEESRGTGALQFTKQKRKHTQNKTQNKPPPKRKKKARHRPRSLVAVSTAYLGLRSPLGNILPATNPGKAHRALYYLLTQGGSQTFQTVSTLLMGCRSQIAGLWLAF